MNILVSNDDGVLAPGLHALVKGLSSLANVEVVAPDRNRSGASNSLSLLTPLRVRQLENKYYSVDGTPTDCVHLALTGLLSTSIDIVISGINEGPNLGDDVLYSGTVAAAMEGRFLGFPAIAVSLVGSETRYYDTAAKIVNQLVSKLSSNPLSQQTILNVNVPALPLEQIKGIEITRLGKRHFAEPMIPGKDPRDRAFYWIGPPGPEADAGPGTDFYAISQQKISVTPIHLDITHYSMFDHLSSWIKEMSNCMV